MISLFHKETLEKHLMIMTLALYSWISRDRNLYLVCSLKISYYFIRIICINRVIHIIRYLPCLFQ